MEDKCDFLPIGVFREFEKRIDQAIVSQGKMSDIVHASSKEAIDKAEKAQGAKFDNLNEFNTRMKELQETYLPRETFRGYEDRIRSLENAKSNLEGRMWALAGILVLVQIVLQFWKH